MAQNNLQLALFSEMPPTQNQLTRKDHLTFKGNHGRGRHGWLRLTPAYSVHLVEELIGNLSPSDHVLDPFCGTGTTALVCAKAGIPCDTVDINPFLIWLTNAKSAQYTIDDVEQAHETLAQALEVCNVSSEAAWIPPIKDIYKWWEPDILTLLAKVFESIRQADVSIQAHNLLLIIFCRASIALAAVSFGHQSMSFRKAPALPALFTVSPLEQVRNAFVFSQNEVLYSVHGEQPHNCAVAFLEDSRQLDTMLPHHNYTTVITSPPYPNRMSYIRELRPYMYWLGYLQTGRQAGEIDWQAIGGTWGCATSNLTAWVPDARYRIPSDDCAETFSAITAHSKILGAYVTKYFQDILQHIRSLLPILTPGAQVHYVVGNSKFYDVMLHTEQIYGTIFNEVGFKDVTIKAIRKRTSKKELYEYLVSARA